MAEDFASRMLATLRPRYEGRWHLWYVRCYASPGSWCAAPYGSAVSTIRAGSAEELVRAIDEADARSALVSERHDAQDVGSPIRTSGKNQVTAD